MDISETHLSGGGYDIRLPDFNKPEPARFYRRMAEEMIEYISSSAAVKRYCASFSVANDDSGETKVAVEIRARLASDGKTSRCRKVLRQVWKSGELLSYSHEAAHTGI